jgi:hypothetical protein
MRIKSCQFGITKSACKGNKGSTYPKGQSPTHIASDFCYERWSFEDASTNDDANDNSYSS